MRQDVRWEVTYWSLAVRRAMLTLLVAIYLLVGFAGNMECASEALDAAGPSDTISLASDDGGTKKSPSVVDHCYTCVPLTIPAAAEIIAPVAVTVQRSLPPDQIVVFEKRFLDPPPPKSLT